MYIYRKSVNQIVDVTIDILRITYYSKRMIKSFKNKDVRKLYEQGVCSARLRPFRAVAERKLQILDSACSINDLRVPPGNALEKLAGDRKDQWSIRINKQYRLCFTYSRGNAYDIEIVDYH